MLGFLNRFRDLDRLAITLVLTGVGLLVLHLTVFHRDRDVVALALVAFYVCEIAGMVCGLMARRTKLGRAAAWVSAFCLVGSLLVLG